MSQTTPDATEPQESKGVSFEAVREIALALPGVEEGSSYGTAAFRVGGRFLARLREDGEALAVRMAFDERDLLLEADPEVFFLTDHYVGHAALLVRLATVRRGQLIDVLEIAWRARVPKRLVREYDSESTRE